MLRNPRPTGTSRRTRPSRRDKMILGAIARAAEAVGVDPTVVRVIWVIGSIFGAGAVVALIALILIPWSRSRRA